MSQTNYKIITCPHCFGEVPYGAKVCRGCQAEIEYGIPEWLFFIFLIFSVWVGWHSSGILAWVTGIATFFACCIISERYLFKNRIVFKRKYHK
jgi:hypothetical protein